jgi:hypothetical protein
MAPTEQITPKRPKGRPAKPSDPYLKGKNAIYLWSFLSVNLAIFLCLFVSKSLTVPMLDLSWKRVTMKDGIIAASIPLLAIVLSGVLGDTLKARVVFWRWKHPLPGCRVFTELMKDDPRIQPPLLRKKLGDLPRQPQAQNGLWFGLYERHSGARRVLEAHRIYLLTRDMAGLAFLFVVLLPLGVFLSSRHWAVAGLYAIALLVQYVLIATSARNYGNRFVLNVLVEELHT